MPGFVSLRSLSGSSLFAKLNQAGTLEASDRAKLAAITSHPYKVPPHSDIIEEGDNPECVHLVVSGIACRYKVLPDGSRSIMALLIPGDFCDLHIAILGRMDHAIGTLTPCEIVDIPRATIDDLTRNDPRITQTLWWATLVDEAILREWLVSMGRRKAPRQLAHLLCEIAVRLETVGAAEDGGFDFPVTQEILSDILGMSLVHVNRMFQQLAKKNLAVMHAGFVKIPDRHRLWEFAEFDPAYLHLSRHSRKAIASLKETSERV